MGDEMLFDPKQLNLPFTIAIIKPDTVLSGGLAEILKEIEGEFTIHSMVQRELCREEAINLYYKHANKNYFEDLVAYHLSGECCVMVLCQKENEKSGEEGGGKVSDPIGKWKRLIGPMDPEQGKKTAGNSLRARFGKSLIKNEFHGSDNPVQANKQRKIFQFRVPQKPPLYQQDPYKLTLRTMVQFLSPPNLEHSIINQRMDLMALYGPIVNWHSIEQCFCSTCTPIVRVYSQKKAKAEAPEKLITKLHKQTTTRAKKMLKIPDLDKLREELCQRCLSHIGQYTHLLGGRESEHVLTDGEISQLAKQTNRDELIQMLTIEKGSMAKIMVEKLEKHEPQEIQYSIEHFKKLLEQLETDYYERYSFTEVQNLVLEDRRVRISYWVAKVTQKSIDRFPPVTSLDNTLTKEQLSNPVSPFFTLSRKLPLTLLVPARKLTDVPTELEPSILDKRRLYQAEQNLVAEKLLHRNLMKVTAVGRNEGKKNEGIREAVFLLRKGYHEGRHGSWDNYSILKGNSVKGPTGGKNLFQ